MKWRGARVMLWLAAWGAGGLAFGCARAERAMVTALPETTAAVAANGAPFAAEEDILAYLHRVHENTKRLEQYTVVLTRQERRGFGLLRRLHDPEEIHCWYRRTPLSVRFVWADPEVKYGESVYVRGEQRDRVRFSPRWWPFWPRPEIVRVGLMTPVVWGEARYPVDEFGLEFLIRRTLLYVEQAEGRAEVEWLGTVPTPGQGRPAHRLRILYPAEQHAAPIQELLIDVERVLPAGTYSYFEDGRLDTSYVYTQLNTDVSLTDEDFLLEREREAAERVSN